MNISAWINTSKAGNQYMSLKFEEPMQRQEVNAGSHDYESTTTAVSTDEVPF